ncbi:MAG: alpha/beta-hydrolase family protein [Mangrovicoccus sp.]|nr:alpha/beta-hydrolase family protein [Mangrovicoccus sp.]
MFFTASLTPSLVPRDPVAQGVLGGVVAIIGYHLGRWAAVAWHWLELPYLPPSVLPGLRIAMALLGLGVLGFGLSQLAQWQNATRAVMDLPLLNWREMRPALVLACGLGVFLALWGFFRLAGALLLRLQRALGRFLPRKIAMGLGLAATAWLVWALVDGVLVNRLLRAADASFEAADILIEPNIAQPSDPQITGSPASVVAWDRMGRWGRHFVTHAPSQAELAEFSGAEVKQPIRVYIGRRSERSPEARARLALQELIRVGGFERKYLVVVVPVGTGWMDPGGHDTLELITGGDVATVAVQYSYLTSALSLMVHPEYGVDQARVLFDMIYDHWTRLPKATRPKLYVHGLSQGSFNSQRTLRLDNMLADPIAGALWAGSPFLSPFWQNVRDQREKGSTEWQPQFGNGSLVRVVTQNGQALPGQAPWGPVRMVFLHYASDPIVAFTFRSAFQRPDWFSEPRAPDVSEKLNWFPIVTMFQLALDMAVSLQYEGFGHYYVGDDYIDAWAMLLDPPNWSPERAEQLRAIYARRGPAF